VSDALKGTHVLVTRPEHQAENLCHLIEQQGGVAVRFPVLQIIGLDYDAATNPLDKLSKPHWLVFTSANAVNFALKAIGGKIAQLAATQIAAIGKATAKELELAGLSVDLIPENGFDSESLLAMPQLHDIKGQTVLIIKGRGGREELANTLRSRGAIVEYWDVYQRVMPGYDNSRVLGMIGRDKLDAIIITSGDALQNLLKMIGENHQKRIVAMPLVVISERISRLATEMGFMRITVAENPSDTAILNAVIAIINERVN
jgi:uroporphyrinogen-III synthase